MQFFIGVVVVVEHRAQLSVEQEVWEPQQPAAQAEAAGVPEEPAVRPLGVFLR